MMTAARTTHDELRRALRRLCADFPDAYWRERDRERAYPAEFVEAMTRAGWLAALIPAEYGGLGLGIGEAGVILEEVHRSGGNAAACHAQMYTMGALLRHGSPAQKARWLPPIARGELRLQAFSVTEAGAGSDTTAIATTATPTADGYRISGHKSWTSRIEQSDLAIVLARTTPRDELADRTLGLSLFLVDLREARAQEALDVRPVRTMFTYATYQVTYRDLEVPDDALIGEEGRGFRYVIDGWNAERILLASEAIGDGYWFTERAVARANGRRIFGGSLGRNQGVAFPLARAYADLIAADHVRQVAAAKSDRGEPCGAEANMAKLLASEASWKLANVCLDIHGGDGFVDEHDVERKFRETRLFQVAPVGNNLILAYIGNKVLGLEKSY
jgi:acyl-CoA dehydrogenase